MGDVGVDKPMEGSQSYIDRKVRSSKWLNVTVSRAQACLRSLWETNPRDDITACISKQAGQ